MLWNRLENKLHDSHYSKTVSLGYTDSSYGKLMLRKINEDHRVEVKKGYFILDET
jgi:hypothetical protein